MTERQMQTFFSKHVQQYPPIQTEAYELKIVKGTSLSFDAVKPHQEVALLQAEQSNLFYKISDTPWIKDNPMRFTAPKPFDCFVLVKVQSYVVLWYYKLRKPKYFIKIPIKAFIAEREKGLRKSLTEETAKEIGKEIFIKIT